MSKLVKSAVLNIPEEDPDYLICMDYLKWVEFENKTTLQFAEYKQVDPTTIWRWISRWKKSGLIQKCRKEFALAVFDDVIVANRKVVTGWSKIAEELVRISTKARSEHTRFLTAAWLYEKIVEPAMNEQEEPGYNEAAYLSTISENRKALNPMSLVDEDE